MSLSRIRAIESVKAFVNEDIYIIQIIEALNLHIKDDNWKKWYDDYGYCLSLTNSGFNVLSSPLLNKGNNKDIYYKAGIKKLSEISSSALIMYLKSSNSITEDVIYIWFLCDDGRVRFISFYSDRWSNQEPPLSKGLLPLKFLFDNMDNDSFVSVRKRRYINSGNFSVENIWFTQWPPNNKCKLTLLLASSYLGRTILKDSGLQ